MLHPATTSNNRQHYEQPHSHRKNLSVLRCALHGKNHRDGLLLPQLCKGGVQAKKQKPPNLEKAVCRDRDEIPRDRLLKEGFDFAYHTHHVITKTKSNEFVFCFGYGYGEVRPICIKLSRRLSQKRNERICKIGNRIYLKANQSPIL